MPPQGHDPSWPDKAMFSAMLLIMASVVGLLFQLVRPVLDINEKGMPLNFADDWPGYEYALLGATFVFGILSLRKQAAVFAYIGAGCAIASLAVYGLVPALGIFAIVMIILSHLEGEETSNDGVELESHLWPDKAMAASLMMTVVGAIAVTQGALMFADRFAPILLSNETVAGSIGVLVGLLGLVAAWEVYHLRNPWLGWVALVAGTATMGFYLIGPVLAIAGMVLLWKAHGENEFDPETFAAKPKSRTKGKRAKAKTTA